MGRRRWNKILGITKAKRAIAKVTGVPTTRSGRQAKVGRLAGCSVILFALGLSGVGLVVARFISG